MRLKLLDQRTGQLVDPRGEYDEDTRPVLTAHINDGVRPTVAAFLRAIHPGPGYLELRAFGAGRRVQKFLPLPLDDIDPVRDFARAHQNLDLYHAIAQRRDSSSGKLENCTTLSALFVDIDLKHGVPMSVIWKDLQAFALQPTFIVHSGGGLHVYWVLSEPIDLTTPLGVARAYQWLGDLATRLHGDMPVADLNKPAVPLTTSDPADHGLDVPTRVKCAKEWLASKAPAVEGQGGNSHTYAMCCAVAHGHDLDEDDAFSAMREWNARCSPPWSSGELRQIIRNAIRYAKGPRGSKLFERDKKSGALRAKSQRNIRIALDELGVRLRYNDFTLKIEVEWNGRREHLEDAIRNEVWLAIDERFRFQSPQDFFDMMLGQIAREHTYHPVRDYLNALQWDGVHRLDAWLTTYAGAEDTPYTRAVGRLFMVAAARRVRTPGSKYDELLTLVSGQGYDKSTGLRTLCPESEWFSDDLPLNVDSKQVIERTTGKWIIEASDLQGYGKREVEHLKAMLSRQVDGPVRLAYARMSTSRSRHFVLVGTTNNTYFLGKDKTGHRRFWPVEVQRLDVAAIRRDRDQLWAEAAFAETAGESIRLDSTLWPDAAERQAAHEVEDEWLVTLRDALRVGTDKPMDRLLLDEPWKILNIDVKDRDQARAERMAAVMQALGYVKMQARGALAADTKNTKRWVLNATATTMKRGRLPGVPRS